MVVGVLEADLHRVVVDVAHGNVRLHAGNAHRLELEVRHRAGRILGEGLVDVDAELGVLRGIALDEMGGKYLLNDVLCYFHNLLLYHNWTASARAKPMWAPLRNKVRIRRFGPVSIPAAAPRH